ncbi:universal stress protein [uncultured Polaribacter sp.]|uniref:universal stress protein n=1 Tax=uncultured Polaribacter sp. TaxID=174711 RepID=UPI00262EFFAA|nr:universal stress protein [uncultured Polaribacter sp.]
MKVLIPTDFSQLSKIAIQYAIDLNKDIKFDLVLLHFINTNSQPMTRISSRKLEEAIKIGSKRDMDELIKSIKKENNNNIQISTRIIFGTSMAKEVEVFALKNNVDIICIGTKGATGIKKIIFGSNAASIITNSSLPVLTIPEHASYKGINNIVYSSDLQNLEEELETIIPFAKLLKSWIHILHIKKENEDFEEDLHLRERRLKIIFSYKNIKVKELQSVSIVEGINQYVSDINADMVTMFTHSTSLFEKIFNKSVTQNTAFQTKTPLLTFQKE